MTGVDVRKLRALQGARVSVALRGGARLDDCCLVSARIGRSKVWLVLDDDDFFVDIDEVIDLWESPPKAGRVA